MAVAFRAESHSIATTGANANPGEPVGTASGDILIGLIVVSGVLAAPSLPTGWTSLYSGTSTNGTTSNGFKFAVGWIARGAGAAATTFTNASGYREAYIIAVSGGNTAALDSTSSSGTFFSSTANPNPPATTAVSSAALAVSGAIAWGGSNTGGWTAPTGYTIRSNNAAGNDGAIVTKLLSAAGSEDPGAFSNVGGISSDGWNGFTLTIAPASSAVNGTAALSGAATLTTTGTTTVPGTAALSAAATLTTTGSTTVPGVAALTGAATLTTVGSTTVSGTAAMAADSTLTTVGAVGYFGTAPLAAAATLTTVGSVLVPGAAALAADSTLTTTGSVTVPGVVAMTASSSLHTVGTVPGGVTDTVPIFLERGRVVFRIA